MTAADVRALRERRGETQEEFAHALAVTVSTVNRWENGHAFPSKLATAALERLQDVTAMTAPRFRALTTEERMQLARWLHRHGEKHPEAERETLAQVARGMSVGAALRLSGADATVVATLLDHALEAMGAA